MILIPENVVVSPPMRPHNLLPMNTAQTLRRVQRWVTTPTLVSLMNDCKTTLFYKTEASAGATVKARGLESGSQRRTNREDAILAQESLLFYLSSVTY